jgi:hypothetical protein
LRKTKVIFLESQYTWNSWPILGGVVYNFFAEVHITSIITFIYTFEHNNGMASRPIVRQGTECCCKFTCGSTKNGRPFFSAVAEKVIPNKALNLIQRELTRMEPMIDRHPADICRLRQGVLNAVDDVAVAWEGRKRNDTSWKVEYLPTSELVKRLEEYADRKIEQGRWALPLELKMIAGMLEMINGRNLRAPRIGQDSTQP